MRPAWASKGGGAGLLAGLLAAALSPAPARAHPHVFIDGGVDFLFDDAGRLDRLRVTWIYDPLTSLFMMEDLGIDPGAALQPEQRVELAAYQTEWVEGFDGDSYLSHDDAPVGLSGPLAPDAEVRDGKVVIRFERQVEAPFRPDPEAVVSVHDPTYYTAYTVTDAPVLEGAATGCAAEVVPFVATSALSALQTSLWDIPPEETPEDDDIGALFADRIRLTCD